MPLMQTLSTTITFIFLIAILSYYALFFIPRKKPKLKKIHLNISIIIPAHNESQYLEQCLKSVMDAEFYGKKQIIVIDDGSSDDTLNIAKKFQSKDILVISRKHSGKSASLNLGISLAFHELIAIVDADSIIHKNSLKEMALEMERENVAAATGIVKVKNREKIFPMWSHIEQLYNSLMRLLFSKINANITTPGPLSMYKKEKLKEIGGFNTNCFSEDVDVTIRLIRKGYKVGFAEKSVAETNIPYDIKGFFRQRRRFARGLINIIKNNLKANTKIIDLYTMPLLLFSYVQAVIIGSFTIFQISSGYYKYFISQGIYFSLPVLRFFFDWLSIIGFIKWAYNVLIGQIPLTFPTLIGIVSTLLSYPLFIIAIIKFDKKFDLRHLIPFVFMFPFWLLIMVIYLLSFPEYFKKNQYNIWKKNE